MSDLSSYGILWLYWDRYMFLFGRYLTCFCSLLPLSTLTTTTNDNDVVIYIFWSPRGVMMKRYKINVEKKRQLSEWESAAIVIQSANNYTTLKRIFLAIFRESNEQDIGDGKNKIHENGIKHSIFTLFH